MLNHEYDKMREVEDDYWWYRVLRGITTREVTRLLPVDQPAQILDAGCGTGGAMQALRQASALWELHGIDLSPLAVAHTRKRGFEHVSSGSVGALNAPDGMFDGVISLDVLYHAGLDQDRAIAEFHRVAKPGGFLILNLPAFDCLSGRHDVAVSGARRYTADQVRKLLTAHGYAVETVHYWNAWLFLPILAWRQLSRLGASANAAEAISDLSPLPSLPNHFLSAIGALDARLCRALALPFGTSVFSVARKAG